MLKPFKKFFTNPFQILNLVSSKIKNKFFYSYYENKAKMFFKKRNYIRYFEILENIKIKPEYVDLYIIFNLIKKRKPKCVLEFGAGCSSFAIILALIENQKENNIDGKLFSVDGNDKWLSNILKLLPKNFLEYSSFLYSKPKISSFNNQIISMHDDLPDISPNFIYLDGPSHRDVEGDIKNIMFKEKIIEDNKSKFKYIKKHRRIIAADPLLYETTSPSDFFILVDRRWSNANFLKKNFKLDYDIKFDLSFGGRVTFEKKYQTFN